jgi:putative membrane protein
VSNLPGNTKKPISISETLLNFVRGSLIGIAELIPGISGGTIALITGVYKRVIDSAAEAVRGIVLLFGFSKSNFAKSTTHFKAISWSLLIPMLIGMVTAIFVGAGIVELLLEQYPTVTKAVFAGLIAASLFVPITLSGMGWKLSHYLVLVLSALAAFAFTSIPRAADADPSFIVIVVSAAFAVCALVLPGISGSYLLLALGMYAPTLAAVNDRDFGYLGTFILGAILGLASFVSLLQWLLANKIKMTMVVMTGLMIGSLRALWPWQSETGAILMPGASFGLELLMFGVGSAIVLGLIVIERRMGHK